MRLKEKVAVITGGNGGIGFGIAQEFKNEGAQGAIFGRTQRTLDESVEKLGSDFIAVRGDVTKIDDLERLYEQTIQRFGKMDILVANAGGAIGPGTIGLDLPPYSVPLAMLGLWRSFVPSEGCGA